MRHVDKPLRNKMSNLAFTLPGAIEREQGCAQRLATLLLKQTWPDDDVHVSGLVLERHKHHTLRGAGPLPNRDQPAAASELSVAIGPQRRRGHQARLEQLRSQ